VINRNLIIRRADEDDVPPQTVERDYVLAHVLSSIAEAEDARLIFKGGTALRLCHLDDYRYSADLDFSLVGEIDLVGARQLVADALDRCREAVGFPALELTADLLRIEYQGPLGGRRSIKLDVADNELVVDTTRKPIALRYEDQQAQECVVYTLEEIAAEKVRCVIQRLQCRDLFDLHQLFVVEEIDPDFIWPTFEKKAAHKGIDPASFAERFEARVPHYKKRWEDELGEHLPGALPPFDGLLREVRRALRGQLKAN
jgi:predicted nucleotidyltransferase component of viral defense system